MEYLEKNIWATVVVLILALIGYFFTPKHRSAFGYKTPMSLKNDETWNYANSVAKNLFFIVVAVFIMAELSLYYYCENHQLAYKISFITLTICSILIVPIVELKLNQKFDKNGKRKS